MTDIQEEGTVTEPTQYRKKPVVITAMQWDGTAEGALPIIDWILAGGGTVSYSEDLAHGWPAFSILTLEGGMQVGPGDYVIRGVQGEFYPCKPGIFAATYEAA